MDVLYTVLLYLLQAKEREWHFEIHALKICLWKEV